jgi:hypothetical protein
LKQLKEGLFVDVDVATLRVGSPTRNNVPTLPVPQERPAMRVGSPPRNNVSVITERPAMRVGSPTRKNALKIVEQRWVFARLVGNLTKLFPPVQFPSQDQLQALESEDLEKFQICGVLYQNDQKIDFIFSNGFKTNSGMGQPTKEILIKPTGALIRKIEIQYYIDENYGGDLLFGLRFLDKDSYTLLECGNWTAPDKSYINHTMVINEDERIFGMRSKTIGSYPGYHFDIEFLLCKLK